MIDENKLRNKANNVIRFANGEEIRTETAAELNSNIIRAEMKAVVLRSLTEQYQTL
jgi:hypothetical protein